MSRAFFLAMDDLAIHLDTAIGDALDGDAGALARIRRFRKQILSRVNKRLLAGEDTSIGSNLLLSAATEAREAAIDEDQHRLVEARKDVSETRDKLAAEALR